MIKAFLCLTTLGKPAVNGTVTKAIILENFFMLPAIGFPSIPSCMFN